MREGVKLFPRQNPLQPGRVSQENNEKSCSRPSKPEDENFEIVTSSSLARLGLGEFNFPVFFIESRSDMHQ